MRLHVGLHIAILRYVNLIYFVRDVTEVEKNYVRVCFCLS